jgi:hypothetical protein
MVVGGVLLYIFAARNDSPELIFREAISPCSFSPPGARLAAPFGRGVKFCAGAPVRPYIELMNHMILGAQPEDEALIAAEFGSLVRVIYLPAESIFMFNPMAMDLGDSEMVSCKDDVGGVVVETLRPNKVRVDFVNSNFQSQTLVFERGLACLLQAAMEVM